LKQLENGSAILPGTRTPPVVRGSYDVPIPAGALPATPVPADVFQSYNNVRNAVMIHCPAGLNHAISLAHKIRQVR